MQAGLGATRHGQFTLLSAPVRPATQRVLRLHVQFTPRAATCTRRKTLGTAGEQEVIRLVVKGLLNKQIAARLDLSEITVKVRRGNAMRKMQTASLAELVRVAEKLGM